jgi:hypothetical protein
MLEYPAPALRLTTSASAEQQVITTIHPRAEAITIIIVTIILLTGYFTGFPGRIAVVLSATTGALLSHSVTSGRTTIVDSSLSVSAVTGLATHIDAITGMDGILTAGTAIIRRNT